MGSLVIWVCRRDCRALECWRNLSRLSPSSLNLVQSKTIRNFTGPPLCIGSFGPSESGYLYITHKPLIWWPMQEVEVPQAVQDYFWLTLCTETRGNRILKSKEVKAVELPFLDVVVSRLGTRERTTPVFRLPIPTTASSSTNTTLLISSARVCYA